MKVYPNIAVLTGIIDMAFYARIDMFYIQTMNNDDQLKISAVPNQILKWHTAKKHYRKFETNIPRKGIARPKSQFPHSCICERFLYSHDQSAYSAAGNMLTDSGNTYINHSQTLECGKWDWGRAISRKGIHKWDVTMLSITDYGLRAYGGLTHGLTAILIFLMSMLPAIGSRLIVWQKSLS